MRPFQFSRALDPDEAIIAHRAQSSTADVGAINATSQYLAGGTTLLDLMKLDVMQPSRVIDINGLTDMATIDAGSEGLRLGALARMADVADDADLREHFPMVAQALQLAASAQIRNMATLGGNVLQRTRCSYFRDTSYANCNKRVLGSGCAALEGINRSHAVLGTSEQCIASYPGDFAQALIALDATIEVQGSRGRRELAFETLHRKPGDTPHIETSLEPGELITAFVVPATPFARRSLFLKIRDRESYEFALASAAVALDIDGGAVKDARIALGGVATIPWRAREAEAHLRGQRLDPQRAATAADLAFATAVPRGHNAFKIELGKRTLVRALRQATDRVL
jgi:xanthine dehydrogenase YagS FAD-binding subunit